MKPITYTTTTRRRTSGKHGWIVEVRQNGPRGAILTSFARSLKQRAQQEAREFIAHLEKNPAYSE